ncbi:MAG: hypothetical protein RL662_2113 [Bacteroidota bacterium]|jgi:hypothetical protein
MMTMRMKNLPILDLLLLLVSCSNLENKNIEFLLAEIDQN